MFQSGISAVGSDAVHAGTVPSLRGHRLLCLYHLRGVRGRLLARHRLHEGNLRPGK